MPDLICLGEPMMEFNEQPDGQFLRGHGGDTSNCAIAAARQGADVGVVTHLGADTFGDSFIDLWTREGVDCSGVRQMGDAPTGIYFVTHDQDGHAFSYYRKGSASARMSVADLPRDVLASARILHVSGISQAISGAAADAVFEAMEIVRSAGGQVSYDTNLRLSLWPLDRARAVIHGAVAQSDIALPGMDDAALLTGLSDPDTIADYYLGLGPKVVALTLGSEGSLVATPENRQRIPGRKMDAVDATGAGDTFDGAFLARLLAGDTPFEAAEYANIAAGLATTGFGAVAPMPLAAAVLALQSLT